MTADHLCGFGFLVYMNWKIQNKPIRHFSILFLFHLSYGWNVNHSPGKKRNDWVTRFVLKPCLEQCSLSDVYWTVHHCDSWRIKNQLDTTWYIIVILISSTYFGHYYAHHQELANVMLITTLVVSFCKDRRGSVNVKLWFLVVCVRCEVICCSVVLDNVFLLILIVVIHCVWWS